VHGVAVAVLVLVVAAEGWLLLRSGMEPTTGPPFPRWSFVDFRDTLWLPTRDVLDGNDPYDLHAYLERHPQAQEFSLYAPMFLLLGIPIAVLPWPVAGAVWFAVLVAAFVVLVRTSLALLGLQRSIALVAGVTAVVMVAPVGNQPISSGQYAVVAAAAAVVAVTSPGRWVPVLATALALVKPQVGLPLLVLLVLFGRRRTAAEGLGLAVLVSLPVAVLLAVRSGGPLTWVQTLADNLAATMNSPFTAAGREASTRIDLPGTLARVGVDLPSAVTLVVTLVALVLSVLAVRATLKVCADLPRDVAVCWTGAAATALMTLWTPTELYAYLVSLPAVIAAVVILLRRRDRTSWLLAAPGLVLLVPWLHVHQVDALLGLPSQTAGLNGLAVLVGGVVLPLVLTRRADLVRCAD
jgi:hypothetical protein